MAIQNGLKRIIKIYHGSDLVYDDVKYRWIPITPPSGMFVNDPLKYMITDDLIVFRGQFDYGTLPLSDLVTVPNSITLTGLLGVTSIPGTDNVGILSTDSDGQPPITFSISGKTIKIQPLYPNTGVGYNLGNLQATIK